MNISERTALMSNLYKAERGFLIACGWTTITQGLRGGGSVTRWISPRNGDECDLWGALAREKLHLDYDRFSNAEEREITTG